MHRKTGHRTAALAASLTAALAGCGDDARSDGHEAETTIVEPVWGPDDGPDAAAGAYMSVWGTGPGDVYTVGGQPTLGGSDGSRAIYRFDGAAWSEVSVPPGGMLNWVHGAGDTMWVVGEGGAALRFEGGTFVEEVDTGAGTTLWGIWCARADRCWAVGGDPRGADSAPTMVALDGDTWSPVALPETERPARALFKIWGTSDEQIIAIGSVGLAYHFDGTAWTEAPTGVGVDLISLWGRGPDDIVAVGGRINGQLVRWDGSAWTTEVLGGVPGLNGVWMNSEGTAYAGGVNGRLVRIPAGTFDAEPMDSGFARVVHAVWGRDAGPFFAVGGSLDRNPPYIGEAAFASGASE